MRPFCHTRPVRAIAKVGKTGRAFPRIVGLMRAVFLSLLVLTLPVPAFAADPAPPAKPAEEAIPEPVTEYMGREVAQTMHWSGAEWLLRENREQEALMMKELRIQPGWTICDLGCGNGYHSLAMSAMTGEKGKILAVDVQQQMLDMLEGRAESRKIDNITPILGAYHDPKLPPASCDLILLVDVYHEFSHPGPMLAAMRKALKPDGRVALVEFRSEDDGVPIKPEHKMSKAQILKEWLPAGFAVEREFDGLPWQHLVFFRKADSVPSAGSGAPSAPKKEKSTP